MSNFCKRCSIEIFDEDFEDMKGLSSEEDTKNGQFASALCEHCGYIQVDHTGKCITHTEEEHKKIYDDFNKGCGGNKDE